MTQGRNEIVLIPTRVISNQEKSEALFFLGKELYNTDNLQQGVIGTLIICIEEQELNEICNGARNQEYQENSITFITDSGGTVLSFPNQNMIGTIVTDEQNEIDFIHEAEIFSSKNLNSSSYQDEKTGWIFYNVYDQDHFMKDVSRLQMIYWFLLLLDVFVVLIFINSINHYFINYLNQIMEGIRQVEKGNFDVQLVVDRRDEFGRIGENFNHMTGTVKELIQEVQEISQKKTKAEIKALEYQINPHFLYNTLDAINWMAVEKNEFEISRMVSNLGFILRYSINKENERVKLSDVEEWLKSYVPLYQIRYGYSFEFQIYMEDEVREKKIQIGRAHV